jgi:hypothetical protein
MASPALSGSAFLHHRRGERHRGLQPAQIHGENRAIQLAQRLQAQPTIVTDDDLNLIAFPQTGLTQTSSGETQGQAVSPAAD